MRRKHIMTNTNQPLKKLKDKGIVVTIWKNEGEEKTFYNTCFEKRYKNGEEWESTNVLNETDLLIASHLLSRAYDLIAEFKQS